jgi:hypothetical protein
MSQTYLTTEELASPSSAVPDASAARRRPRRVVPNGAVCPVFGAPATKPLSTTGRLAEQARSFAMPRAQRLAEHRRTVADRATGHRRAGHGSRTATLVSDDGGRVVLAPIGDRRGP